MPVSVPAPSRCANQALAYGPSRRVSVRDAARTTSGVKPRSPVRYVQVGEPRTTGLRAVQRSSAGRSAALSFGARSAAGKDGASPDSSRNCRRTWPKLRLGSRCWASLNTSPLAVLPVSHQPRPSWLTMTVSPAPRRYFRFARLLSLSSSLYPALSSSTAQFTPARS